MVLGCKPPPDDLLFPSDKDKLSFHSFPSELGFRQMWLDNLGVEEVCATATVCSKHFTAACFKDEGTKDQKLSRRILHPGAFPTKQLGKGRPNCKLPHRRFYPPGQGPLTAASSPPGEEPLTAASSSPGEEPPTAASSAELQDLSPDVDSLVTADPGTGVSPPKRRLVDPGEVMGEHSYAAFIPVDRDALEKMALQNAKQRQEITDLHEERRLNRERIKRLTAGLAKASKLIAELKR